MLPLVMTAAMDTTSPITLRTYSATGADPDRVLLDVVGEAGAPHLGDLCRSRSRSVDRIERNAGG